MSHQKHAVSTSRRMEESLSFDLRAAGRETKSSMQTSWVGFEHLEAVKGKQSAVRTTLCMRIFSFFRLANDPACAI